MSSCGCTIEKDCPTAARLWTSVLSLYEDAKDTGYQEKFFNRYKQAMDRFRDHRQKALSK
jgi:hypothetical protein